jgi:hypothetical protein
MQFYLKEISEWSVLKKDNVERKDGRILTKQFYEADLDGYAARGGRTRRKYIV